MTKDLPWPFVEVSDEEAFLAFFPDGNPTDSTPIGAAWLWWAALLQRKNYRAELRQLCVNPADWGDFEEVAKMLDGYSLLQVAEPSPEAPDEVAYAKFIRDVGASAKAVADSQFPVGYWLTVVTSPGFGAWRVWGISPSGYRPNLARIKAS